MRRTLKKRKKKRKEKKISIIKWKKPIMENKIVGTREEEFLRLLEIRHWVSTLHCALSAGK